jgi:hypothetical protein
MFKHCKYFVWPNMRKIVLLIEKNFRGLANFLKSSQLNNSNSEKSEQVLKSEYFFNLSLEVSEI